MTSFSSPSLTHGLDTMILVYYLLQGHPASTICEQFLRAQSAWFTSPLVLVEAKHILTKVYGVAPGAATAKLLQFAAGPAVLFDLDQVALTAALPLADTHGLALTDAVLLHLTQQQGGATLVTEDHQLLQVCGKLGVSAVSPLDTALRQQVTSWEAVNLAPKGLPRILRGVHDWLGRTHPQASSDFWSQTGGGNHLP
jgi:predicted nucleic acid-binding protein